MMEGSLAGTEGSLADDGSVREGEPWKCRGHSVPIFPMGKVRGDTAKGGTGHLGPSRAPRVRRSCFRLA